MGNNDTDVSISFAVGSCIIVSEFFFVGLDWGGVLSCLIYFILFARSSLSKQTQIELGRFMQRAWPVEYNLMG